MLTPKQKKAIADAAEAIHESQARHEAVVHAGFMLVAQAVGYDSAKGGGVILENRVYDSEFRANKGGAVALLDKADWPKAITLAVLEQMEEWQAEELAQARQKLEGK